MNAIQPDSAIARDETLESVFVGLEQEYLEKEYLEIEGLEITGLEVEVLAINKTDRWSIYHRLQELEIPCHCAIEQPLGARIATPTAAFQVWSIARRYRASRHQLLDFLEDCWQTQS